MPNIVSLLEINERPRGATMAMAVILSVGQDYSVLSTRTAVLRSAGYVVEQASSLTEAIDQFRSGDFDLVVLCHSMPLEERQSLIQFIRACGSLLPTLYIAPVSESIRGSLTDGTIGSSPCELLKGIDKALREAMAHSEPHASHS
jgi:CheY-like chemotaxis protein